MQPVEPKVELAVTGSGLCPSGQLVQTPVPGTTVAVPGWQATLAVLAAGPGLPAGGLSAGACPSGHSTHVPPFPAFPLGQCLHASPS